MKAKKNRKQRQEEKERAGYKAQHKTKLEASLTRSCFKVVGVSNNVGQASYISKRLGLGLMLRWSLS